MSEQGARLVAQLEGVAEQLRTAQEVLRDGDAPVRIQGAVQRAEDDVRRACAELASDP